ncbi:MAG: 6-phosphogluconolactonase, partial [Bacteroidia bacterium]|nr:6-phosphogluconolactonase [Bacteroidia bacterium]
MAEIYISNDKESLARDFAYWMLGLLNSSKGDFHVSLSGGSTPKKLFDLLASEFKDSFPWSRMHFWWGDERMVAPDHKESNYGMTYARLFSGVSIPSENIHRVRGEDRPEEEVVRYGRELESFMKNNEGKISFDLMILGMGDDGHTASIFPDNLQSLQFESPTFLATHPQSGQLRVSMTSNLINDSKEIAFLVAGKSKAEKVQVILKNENDPEA